MAIILQFNNDLTRKCWVFFVFLCRKQKGYVFIVQYATYCINDVPLAFNWMWVVVYICETSSVHFGPFLPVIT